MKAILSILAVFLSVFVLASNAGAAVLSDSGLHAWSCEDRIVSSSTERFGNHLFEGDKIIWPSVLVLDSSGINQINDVYVTAGEHQGLGNSIESNCHRKLTGDINACDAPVTEFNPETMAFYECTFTVESADAMHGKSWVTVEAADMNGSLTTINEDELWFFNVANGLRRAVECSVPAVLLTW